MQILELFNFDTAPLAASPLNPWDIQLVVHLLSSLLLLSKMSKYVAGFGEMCRRILKYRNLWDIHGYPGHPIDAATESDHTY